jgi:hypothetical protein
MGSQGTVAWLALTLCGAGCTFDTSGGTSASGGSGGAGGMSSGGAGGAGGSGTGGAGGADAAAVDALPDGPAPDAPISAICVTVDQRVCTSTRTSGHCVPGPGGLIGQTDRFCPPLSFCAGGYCQPPSGALLCSRLSDCPSNKVCDVYTGIFGQFSGYCTDAVPVPGGLYASCDMGGTCQTGLCAIPSGGGPAQAQCLFPCSGANSDCPDGGNCRSLFAPSNLEGSATSNLKACFH